MFEIGKKVVCIKNGQRWLSPSNHDNYGPTKHEVVTISVIDPPEPTLGFFEYDRKNNSGGVETYPHEYFRPLEDFPDQHEFSKEIFDRQERIEILQPDYA